MKLHKKIIPTNYYQTIKDIDFFKLKEQGIKALFFDLDNTLISYDVDIIPNDIKVFLEDLNKEFSVVVVSNSRKKRVSYATSNLEGIPYVKFARKPLKFGFKKALKLTNTKPINAAIIGDQVMTDIFGGNRIKFGATILVYPIKKKSDHFLTRMNRNIEKRLIKKVKRLEPKVYEEVFEEYEK